MKIYRAKNKIGGVKKRISLTDNPAIELKGLMLNKELPNVINLEDYIQLNEEQRIVAAPVIVPNKLIPREDENGEVFFITFTEEDIKEFYELWKKDGEEINFDHSERLAKSAKIVDVFIIDETTKLEGYTHQLDNGTLFMISQYDEKDFNEIKKGEKNAYSLEGDFLLQPFYLSKVDKKEDVKKNTIEVKIDFKQYLDEIKLKRKLIELVSQRVDIVNDIILKINNKNIN